MRGFGLDAVSVVGPTRVELFNLLCSGIQLYVLLSHYLCFNSFLYLDVYVLGKLWIFHANQTSICLDPHQNFA